MMMKSKWTVTFLAILFAGALHAQNWSAGIKGGGTNGQSSAKVAEDQNGNKIVVGAYNGGSATFGPTTLPQTSASSPNSFIVKYTASNTFQWAHRITSNFEAEIAAVTTDAAGNIYVCGAYSSTGSCYFYDSAHTASPAQTLFHVGTVTEGNRGFIAKYSPTGLLHWCRRGIGIVATDEECVSEIAISDDGTQLVVTGRINPAAPFSMGSGADLSTIAAGSYVHWLSPVNGTSTRAYNYSNDGEYATAYNNGLCIDHNNYVIVSAKMTGLSYDVKGKGGIKTATSGNSGQHTLYARYKPTGQVEWALATKGSINNSEKSMPSSLIVDADNNIYIGGWMKSHTLAYDLQFPAPSGTLSINVPTTPTNQAYVVKLRGSDGRALKKSYARNTAAGTEVVSLAKGKCNVLYACINTAGTNPTYTDGSNVTHTATTTQPSLFVYKLNTELELQSLSPWAINNTSGAGYITSNGGLTVQCAASFSTPITMQISGSPVSFTPSSSDMILGSFTDSNPLPGVTLNAGTPLCAYQTIPLSATATGGGPYTYTWSIYNNTTGTFVDVGVGSVPNFNLTPGMYNPYIHVIFGLYTVVYVRVAVTNCWGTSYAYRYYGIKGDISITNQVTEVETCYTSGSAADAVFSVTAVNVDSYQWWYSMDGFNWLTCSGVYDPSDQPTLTIVGPQPSENGYLFRCVMTGCSSVVSSPAELRVIPCPMIRSSETDSEGNPIMTEVTMSLYPNPASSTVNIVLESDKSLAGKLTAMIYDFTGRELHREEMEDSRCMVEINRFANGHYLCVIRQDDAVVGQQQFIVKH